MVQRSKPVHRRRRTVVAVLVLLSAAGLYWFQPWRLWTDTVVDDALPVLAADAAPQTTVPVLPTRTHAVVAIPVETSHVPPARTSAVAPTSHRSAPSNDVPKVAAPASRAPTRPATTPSTSASPPTASLLAAGQLITHEHETSGRVRIVRLADGRRVLTLEGLRTSDGPALHVWLTDAPVLVGEDGWKLFDDGRHVDLGNLKGNLGNQVYPIPTDLDLDRYTSVSIWCERFSVSFGAAELHPA